MKKLRFPLLAATIFFAACNKNSDVVPPPPVIQTETLPNLITADRTLDPKISYVIDGQLFVKNNATLTIPAGTTVSFVKNDALTSKGVMLITAGSKLMVDGTAEKPVVFTSAATTKAPGDWGA